jgi:hypothetical protein
LRSRLPPSVQYGLWSSLWSGLLDLHYCLRFIWSTEQYANHAVVTRCHELGVLRPRRAPSVMSYKVLWKHLPFSPAATGVVGLQWKMRSSMLQHVPMHILLQPCRRRHPARFDSSESSPCHRAFHPSVQPNSLVTYTTQTHIAPATKGLTRHGRLMVSQSEFCLVIAYIRAIYCQPIRGVGGGSSSKALCLRLVHTSPCIADRNFIL